jgi:hypothetical protein
MVTSPPPQLTAQARATQATRALIFALLAIAFALAPHSSAQQTLGAINGEVADETGALIPNVTVTLTSEQSSLTRATKTGSTGSYLFVNLPIGDYTLTWQAQYFVLQKTEHITVQAGRTTNINARLKVGGNIDIITVRPTPLMNSADTTIGYVLDNSDIAEIPLSTGSFTALATLSPGVNAELSGGTGSNSGLGNAPIWANGQRDTSNSFSLNGVDSSNLFNGKSTSQVANSRISNGVGVYGSGNGVLNSAASIYLSIGNALPTPAPETLEELHVNAAMYDASQGSTSGAHIDLSTKSGTNTLHASANFRRGTSWLNAAPFFFNQNADIPANLKVPELHRYEAGFTIGGPIIKNKLFGFAAYRHLRTSDQEVGDSFLDVPVGLSDDRSPGALAAITNNAFGTTLTAANIDPLTLTFFNSPALPGEPGRWLIPNDALVEKNLTPSAAHLDNAFIPGTGIFSADLAVADIDWNATSRDTLALKYFYQHDPTLSPYAFSSIPGFTEHLDSGAHLFSIINSFTVNSHFSTTETLGFIREKNYATNEQPFSPAAIPGGNYGTGSINLFGSNYFPGVTVYNVLGNYQPSGLSMAVLNIGPNAQSQSSNTGVFQNRIAPSGNAILMLGRNQLAFGANYSYTQLNTIDKRTGTGTIATDDFSQMLQGYVTPGSAATGFYVSSFLQGDANRYYRANQLGVYMQDKLELTPTLTLTAGLRYDWDGGLTEKFGRIFNFEPTLYSYAVASDVIANPGFIIAGNNKNGTLGISNTTLTGRQWGIAPRIGAAWQPAVFHNKLVLRTGGGFYYDRGELFSYFSPGYAIGTVTGGPFGVNQQIPFVNASTCPVATQYLYQGYIATCGGTDAQGNLENPYGTSLLPPPTNPKASDLANYLPNANAIANLNGQPISLGVYNRANKLPYSMNYTLDLQWQPRSDLMLELGYIGNLGRHQVIPIPFNQPNIVSPANPVLAGGNFEQKYSYGYKVVGAQLDDNTNYLATYEGGNVDLRVPYIGYAAESISYKAVGVSAYNALAAHIEKRMSHGIRLGFSYTYSHALDEQSGLGLFFSGNNPLNLRQSYGNADFDRTHVINFNYVFALPNRARQHTLLAKLANNWQLVGLTTLQSGQPYSIIDYSGAVGSIYYSTEDGVTDPIVPLAPGCTPHSARTGASGAWTPFGGQPALNAACFTIPLLPAGGLGGAIPSTDPYETGFTTGQRNIFRQAFQKRADISLIKTVTLRDKYNFRYTFDVFNLTNTTSFDAPGNDLSQNSTYDAFPVASTPVLPTGCGTSGAVNNFYSCPSGLGIVTHTIGAPRQIQMSLSFNF